MLTKLSFLVSLLLKKLKEDGHAYRFFFIPEGSRDEGIGNTKQPALARVSIQQKNKQLSVAVSLSPQLHVPGVCMGGWGEGLEGLHDCVRRVSVYNRV